MNATTSNRSAPQIASIAVLPFINLNSEADSEYLSDGLTEELIHVLSQPPNLRVVSRTSAFELKGKPQGVRQTGEQLKVSTIVEGSVRKVGQKLRIRAELVNVADGYCLWSQRFDQDMKVVSVIREISRFHSSTLQKVKGKRTVALTPDFDNQAFCKGLDMPGVVHCCRRGWERMPISDSSVHYWVYGAVSMAAGGAWLLRQLRSRAAQAWPMTEGIVESTTVRIEGFGRSEHDVAEVNYSYRVEGEYYSGAHVVSSEVQFAAFPRQSRVIVHYKPSNPAVSFLDRDDLRSRRDGMMLGAQALEPHKS
jgi:TolB-like protein